MTFEEHLKVAAGEVAEHMAATLPDEATIDVEFSDSFLRSMQEFIDNWDVRKKKQTYLRRHPVVRFVLIAAAIILLVFGMLMAVSPEVRAAVTGWLRQELEDSVMYKFNGPSEIESDNKNAPRFEMTWIPEGYQLYDIDKTDYSTYVYYLMGDKEITFSYTFGSESLDMYILLEDLTREQVNINGMEGEILVSDKNEESSIVIWKDNEQNILFYVDGNEEKDTLIKIAESVKLAKE